MNISTKYGPWALVTGASDGIGKALAQELASRGLNIVLVARNEVRLNQLSEQLKKDFKVETKCIAADLSLKNANEHLMSQVERLDIGLVVAAAGFGTSGTFEKNDLEVEKNMIDLNCTAVVDLVHRFTTVFNKRGNGAFVLFGSLVGFQGTPYASNYAATKAFIQTFAEGIHFELMQKGIDVLAVAPGPVKSGFGDRANMTIDSAPTGADIAPKIVDSIGKKLTVRPGFMSKFLEFALKCLVWRRFRILVMGNIMHNMSK